MTLVLFEIKKIIRNKLFRFMILGVFIFIALFYAFIYMNSNELMKQLLVSENNKISMNEERISELELMIKSNQISEEEAATLEHQIQSLKEIVTDSKTLLSGIEKNDWNVVLGTYIESTQKLIEQEKQFNDSSLNQSIYTLESQVEKNKIIQERNIQPILPFKYSTTIYDQYDSEKSKLASQRDAEQFSANSLFFQKKLFDITLGLVGVLFFILLFADILTKEGFKNGGPINLLNTQPIRNVELFLSKYTACTVIVLGIVTSILLFSTILGIVFDRFGDSTYPILRYEEGLEYSFVNLGTALIQSIILFLSVVTTGISLYFLISYLINNTIGAVTCFIILYFIANGFSELSFFSSYIHFNPFTYFSIPSIITQEKAALAENWNITFGNGMLMNIISILIIWIIILFYSLIKNRHQKYSILKRGRIS